MKEQGGRLASLWDFLAPKGPKALPARVMVTIPIPRSGNQRCLNGWHQGYAKTGIKARGEPQESAWLSVSSVFSVVKVPLVRSLPLRPPRPLR